MPPINDDEFLAWNRFQVGLAVTTGVLVIVITTAAVILLGRTPEPGTDPAPRSRPSTIADPSEVASAVPSATPSEPPATGTASVKPSASKKTPAPVVTTAAPVALTLSLDCPSTASVLSDVTCTISLSAPAVADTLVSIASIPDQMSMPPSATVKATFATVQFTFTTGLIPESVTITVSSAGLGSDTDTVNVG